MKKIVALALCLVLALSLCATAFAAGFSGDSYGAALTAAANGNIVTEVKKLTDNRTTTTAANVTFYPATYLLTKTTTSNGIVTNTETETVVELATEVGANRYYVEGTTVRYFSTDTSLTTAKKLAVATVITDSDKAVCGSVIANDKDDVYYDSVNDEYYVAAGATAGATLAYVNDMLVYVKAAAKATATVANAADQNAGNVQVISHNFKADKTVTKTTDAKATTTFTKLYCTDCKGEFNFVYKDNADAAKLAAQTKFGVGNYKTIANAIDGYYFAYEKTASAASTTAVSSAKTFDAGIALYVGMSISAVAGSAVVIGKKKEF